MRKRIRRTPSYSTLQKALSTIARDVSSPRNCQHWQQSIFKITRKKVNLFIANNIEIVKYSSYDLLKKKHIRIFCKKKSTRRLTFHLIKDSLSSIDERGDISVD